MSTLTAPTKTTRQIPRVLAEFKWKTLHWNILLIAVSLILLYPFVWTLLSALKTNSEILAIPPTFFPQKISVDGFNRVLATGTILRNFLNTVIVCVSGTLISALFSSLGGLIFAKYQFWGKNFFFFCLVSQMMIPIATTVVPLFTLFSSVGLLNTYVALILPVSMSGFGIFLMRQFMMSLPNELFEAAQMDGASDWQLYTMVALPLTRSSLAGVAVYTFLWIWNQFYLPLVVVSKPDMRTLTLAVVNATQSLQVRYDAIAAGSAISVLPIIIVFFFAMRNIVSSLTFSGFREG